MAPATADLLLFRTAENEGEIISPIKEEIILFHRCHTIICAFEQGEKYITDFLLNQEADFFLNLQRKHHVMEKLERGAYQEELTSFLRSVRASRREVVAFLKFLTYFAGFENESYMNHIVTTGEAGVFLAREMGFSKEEQSFMEVICLVHDIGKVYIPESILQKPGPLNEEEKRIVDRHVGYTRLILNELGFKRVSDIAANHHEKLDGSGYPNGFAKEEIDPFEDTAVADIFSALSGKRCYKEAQGREKTCAILQEMAQKGRSTKGPQLRCSITKN